MCLKICVDFRSSQEDLDALEAVIRVHRNRALLVLAPSHLRERTSFRTDQIV